jgi:hypothetical protein
MSFIVMDGPFMSIRYHNSGILPTNRRSIYQKVVFPNIIPRPLLSSRALSWRLLARKKVL